MNHKIRLGPIAVFLIVIVIVLSTLAVLTIATSNADQVMAERFARVTQIKYELEDEGEKYLRDIDEQIEAGDVNIEALGAEETDGGILRKTISKEGYDLVIEISDPGAGEYEVKRWEIVKEWNADNPLDNIWQGGKK